MTKIAENLKCFWKKGGKKKIFFLFFLLLRLLLALVFALMLPVLFFVIFIFREPREIEPINKHLDDLVRSRSSVEEVSYSNAKISINKNFELVYSVENLSFRINEIHLKFPKINFRLKFVDIIRRKFFINEVEIIDLVGYFGYKDHENTDTKNTENENIKLSYTEFSDMVYVFLKYLHNNVLPFNSLKISNNIFYFSNKTTGTVDKLKLVEGDIKIDNRTNINFLFNLKSIINDKKEILRSSNDCVIFDDKKINCKITLNNLPFHDVVEVFKKTTHLKKYAEDINGNFDVRFDVFFEDYRNVKSSRFIITSSAGNFNLKNLFESRINYKNLNINGRTISHRGFILDNVKAKLFVGDNKTIDFSMLLDVKKNELVTMDFDIRNASFEKLYALWPVFLSQLGIRNWVIKHFKSGSITKAHANMDFKYSPKEHKYKLERIGSEVDFTNTYLDYEDTFPPMSKIDARAVFSIDDMKIHVNSAKIENTNITNADIYVNFNDKTPSLDIKAETKGNIYELFYFINNEKQNTIRDIVSNYMNGYARSKIYVDVPFLDNLGLSDVLIEVNSFVENNNTFLFRNNSNININVKKPVNSNTFGVDVNLREALINIKGSSFTKQKNEDLLLKLDIDVLDNRVLLKNIGTNNNAFLYAQADGIINITDKVDFNINFTDLNFVEKYNFKNISISGVYTDKIDQISLSVRNGYNLTGLLTNSKAKNEKYNIAIECNDFGKFLSEMNVTDKFLSGVLYFDGIIYQNNYFGGKIKIKDTFNIITENFRDTKFFKHILDSELVSKKFKRDLKSTNTVGFKKASASIYLSNNILTVDSLTLESSDIFGIGISGKGKYFLNGKKLDFNGLITPVDKINTLFRANKIPLVGKLLFANKNSGLFTIGYTLKSNADGEYVFELIPISVVNPNTLKNLLLIFVLF